MSKNRILLIAASIIGVILSLGYTTYASCGGSWFNSSCETVSPYCVGDSCTLDKGVAITGQVVNGQITSKNIGAYAQDIVMYLMSFISIVAVIYIIYAGFQLMI